MPGLVQQLLPKFLQLSTFHGNPDSVMAVFGTAKDDFIPSKNAFNFSTDHVLFIQILSQFHITYFYPTFLVSEFFKKIWIKSR